MKAINQDHISKHDPQGMLERIVTTHDQLREAQEIAEGLELDLQAQDIANVCLAGMGGSAISGDLARCLYAETLTVPMVVNRYYRLPEFVGRKSLVIVSSYSGNTEESLEAYQDAVRRKAHIFCITSGGQLGAQARECGHPLVSIPTGYPPRTALGFLSVPVLYTLHRAGLVDNPAAALEGTIALLRHLAQAYHPDAGDNPARQIAERLYRAVPLIYASVHRLEAVAMRWKTQLNENSKVMAFHNTYPELNHNEIMGYRALFEKAQRFQIIHLKDREDHPQVQKRMAISREIFERQETPVFEVESRGESRLARLFSHIFLGDMVSFYLAMAYGVDPTPVENIDFLKNKLSE